MIDLRAIARTLKGDVIRCRGRMQALVPGIGHSASDRSVSVRLDPRSPDGFWVHCFGSGDPIAEKDRICNVLGLKHDRKVDQPSRPPPPDPEPKDDAARTAQALAIWREAVHPRETPVEAYLARDRGLALADEIAGATIRYHGRCPFTPGKRTPAMVALVRDIVTDRPIGIHRTALTVDGHKVKVGGSEKLTFGPIRGGAIKLTADEMVTTCLGIAEGIETALTLQLAPEFGPSPVWSVISAGGVAAFPVLAGIECLWISVDNDANQAGIKAAQTCAKRWRDAGREVFFFVTKETGTDLNDAVKGRKRHDA